jgi:hypothetical protein
MHQQHVIWRKVLLHVFRHVILQRHHGGVGVPVQERQFENFKLRHHTRRETRQPPDDVHNSVANLRTQLLGLAAKLHRRVDLHLDTAIGILADLLGPRHQEMLHRIGDRRQERMQPQSDFLRCGGSRTQRKAKRYTRGERNA